MTRILLLETTLKSPGPVKEDFEECMRQLSAPIPNNLLQALSYTIWQSNDQFQIQFRDDAILRAFSPKPNDVWKSHCTDLLRGIASWLLIRSTVVSFSFFSHHQDANRLLSDYKTLDDLLSLTKAPVDMKIILSPVG